MRDRGEGHWTLNSIDNGYVDVVQESCWRCDEAEVLGTGGVAWIPWEDDPDEVKL